MENSETRQRLRIIAGFASVLVTIAVAVGFLFAALLKVYDIEFLRPICFSVGVSVLYLAYRIFLKTVSAMLVEARAIEKEHNDAVINVLSDQLRRPINKLSSEIRSLMEETDHIPLKFRLNSILGQNYRLLSAIDKNYQQSSVQRLEGGNICEVSVSQIISDLAEVFSHTLAERPELILTILVDSKLPKKVAADPKRLMHLISILVDNAIRETKQGSITMTVSASEKEAFVGEKQPILISCSRPRERGEIHAKNSKNEVVLSGKAVEAVPTNADDFRVAEELAYEMGGTLQIVPEGPKVMSVQAEISLKVLSLASEMKSQMPSFIEVCSSSPNLISSIIEIGQFHKLEVREVSDLAKGTKGKHIFVEARDVIEGRFGKFSELSEKERFIVVINQRQISLRQDLIDKGFSRFILLPLVSTQMLHTVAGEGYVVPVSAQNRKHSPTRSLRVLVVDDVSMMRLLVAQQLQQLGHEVREASDGLELISLMTNRKPYDLVFCDIAMTHLDGNLAVRDVREFEKKANRHTPIVAMTAYNPEDDGKELMEFGFDAILTKPIYPEQVSRIIDQFYPQERGEISADTFAVDLEDLHQRTLGNKTLIMKILISFVDLASVHLYVLEQSKTKNDLESQQKALHTLKGLLLGVGAPEAANRVKAFENKVISSTPLDADEVKEIHSIVEGVRERAEKLQNELLA